MIDTKDLRRGNIICASEDENGNPEPCKVFEIYEEGVRWGLLHDDHGGNSTSYKYLEPIPLSPDWLERCGFKIQSDGFWFLKGGYYTIESNGAWYLTIGGGLLARVKIHAVHQLQNYYFVHENEELTIKQ